MSEVLPAQYKMNVSIFEATQQVREELIRATAKHGPMNSLHEAYSVILEELDEVWDEVKKRQENRDPELIRKELIQVAAMAVRAIVDCVDTEKVKAAA